MLAIDTRVLLLLQEALELGLEVGHFGWDYVYLKNI